MEDKQASQTQILTTKGFDFIQSRLAVLIWFEDEYKPLVGSLISRSGELCLSITGFSNVDSMYSYGNAQMDSCDC